VRSGKLPHDFSCNIARINSGPRLTFVLSLDPPVAQKTARSGFAWLFACACLGYDRRYDEFARRVTGREIAVACSRNSRRSARRCDCRSERLVRTDPDKQIRARFDRIIATMFGLARSK